MSDQWRARGVVLPETPDVAGAYPRLTEEQIQVLSRVGDKRSVEEGTALYCAGDHYCDFFVILSGSVVILQETDEGPQPIAAHGPRRFLGDLSQLTSQTLYLTAVAQEPVEVLAVPVDRLREVAIEDPELGDLILRSFLIRRHRHLGLGAGFRIIGSRFSADSRRLRDFAIRNRLPHKWIDLEEDSNAEAILTRLNIKPEQTPVVIWRGREVLHNPSNAELASLMGLRPSEAPVTEVCDLVVVGAGPAGLAAAVYGASEGLSTVVLDAVATGGQAATSSHIENYLGFPAGISGGELADRAVVQARKFGAAFTIPAEAQSLSQVDSSHVVHLNDGGEVAARAVILATGTCYRRLEVPGLDRLERSSVYYAATQMEAMLCRTDPVTVVGGGNSAGQASVFLARQGSEVNLVIRHHDLARDMSRYLADRVEHTPKIRVWSSSEVCELRGEKTLESVVIEEHEAGDRRSVVPTIALFVLIGSVPQTQWLNGQIPLDDRGFVITGRASPTTPDGEAWTGNDVPSTYETGRAGVFAVGDVRSGSVKRVAAAAGEGAMAIRLVHQFLEKAGHG